MGKLMKAELFRTKRITGFWVCVFFITLMMSVVPFINDTKAHSAQSFSMGTFEIFAILGMMVALMAAYITGRGFHHRTCMYEVMAGNSSLRIILSKCFSIALPISLVVYLPHLVGLAVACGINSEGISEVLSREPLFFLTILRMTCFGTLLTLCVRSMAGPVLVYVRLVLESLGMIVVSAITGQDLMEGGADLVTANTTNTIMNTVCLSQQGVLLAQPVDSSLVLKVVIGFAVEVLLWFVISYMIYEKKDY